MSTRVNEIYATQAGMSNAEQERAAKRRALFNNVHKSFPNYFDTKVLLMNETLETTTPCRAYNRGQCKVRHPLYHYQSATRGGRQVSKIIAHICELCFYGTWDVGLHPMEECHLKQMMEGGTGEVPLFRRQRKAREQGGMSFVEEYVPQPINPGNMLPPNIPQYSPTRPSSTVTSETSNTPVAPKSPEGPPPINQSVSETGTPMPMEGGQHSPNLEAIDTLEEFEHFLGQSSGETMTKTDDSNQEEINDFL